mgnify:CR=1 FL=1
MQILGRLYANYTLSDYIFFSLIKNITWLRLQILLWLCAKVRISKLNAKHYCNKSEISCAID